MPLTLRFIKRIATAAATLIVAGAFAADFPAKAVRIITPFPPGGSVDLVARLFAADMSKTWGQQVIVDNRAGASGNIGTELAKNAAPDGYAMVLNTLPFVTNQFVYSTMPFDPLTDFAPISIVSSVDALLVVHPSLPVRNVRDLIALAKSRPGTFSYGTAGAATNPHIAAELLNYMGKINMFAVHYKGGGAATTATISGETPVFFSNTVSDALPLVDAKRLRALGVTSLKRSRSRRKSRHSPNQDCPATNSRRGTWWPCQPQRRAPSSIRSTTRCAQPCARPTLRSAGASAAWKSSPTHPTKRQPTSKRKCRSGAWCSRKEA